MNLKTYYNLQSTQAIFFIKHTSSLGREEASSSFNIINPSSDVHETLMLTPHSAIAASAQGYFRFVLARPKRPSSEIYCVFAL